jgi:hypothetical protein
MVYIIKQQNKKKDTIINCITNLFIIVYFCIKIFIITFITIILQRSEIPKKSIVKILIFQQIRFWHLFF